MSNDIALGKAKTYSNEINNAVKQKIEGNNIQTYDDLINLESSSVSIFSENTKTQEQKDQAYLDYSEKYLLEYYDSDQDGTVTTEEFSLREKQDAEQGMKIEQKYLEEIGIPSTEEDIEREGKIAERLSQQFALNLDSNDDGTVSKEELAFFMKSADEMDGEADGVVLNQAESALVGSYLDINSSDETINNVINKYVNGENMSQAEEITLVTQMYYMGLDLTPEQQEIFDNNNTLIRKNINEANDIKPAENTPAQDETAKSSGNIFQRFFAWLFGIK